MGHGRKYVEAAKLVDHNRVYAPDEAAQLAKDTTTVKFDATVEAHLRLGVDPRHADQMVRGTVVLPNGTGKVVRVAVFAQGEKAQEALRAGADEVGSEDLVKKIEAGWLEFDVALATPDLMGQVGRLGKILGRRGLMPNPKAGTITFDLDRAIREVKGGRVEFKVDKSAIVHVPVGKASFEAEALVANLAALVDAINRAKPSGAKGTYLGRSRSRARWDRASGSTSPASSPPRRPDPVSARCRLRGSAHARRRALASCSPPPRLNPATALGRHGEPAEPRAASRQRWREVRTTEHQPKTACARGPHVA